MGNGPSNNDLAELFGRYGHLMSRRCQILLRDQAEADDALLGAFMQIARSGDTLRGVDARLQWLYGIVDRCCFALIKQRGAQDRPRGVADSCSPHPEAQVELRDAVMSLLDRLRDKERRLAVLAFVDGKRPPEIARELGRTLQAVESKLEAICQRADRQLQPRPGDAARSGAPAESTHPDPLRLESWSVGEPDREVDRHLESCKECRDYVVSMEMAKEQFLDQQEPQAYVKRLDFEQPDTCAENPETNAGSGRSADAPPGDPADAAPVPGPAVDAPVKQPTAGAPAPAPAAAAPAKKPGVPPRFRIPMPQVSARKDAGDGLGGKLRQLRWWIAGPALLVAVVVIAVVVIRTRGPGPEPARRGPDPLPPPGQAAKSTRPTLPLKLGAVITSSDRQQSRATGKVILREGIQIQIELTVPSRMAVSAGILDQSNEWIPLLEGRIYQPGKHFLPNVLGPTAAKVYAGTPEQINTALRNRNYKGLAVLVFETPAKAKYSSP